MERRKKRKGKNSTIALAIDFAWKTEKKLCMSRFKVQCREFVTT